MLAAQGFFFHSWETKEPFICDTEGPHSNKLFIISILCVCHLANLTLPLISPQQRGQWCGKIVEGQSACNQTQLMKKGRRRILQVWICIYTKVMDHNDLYIWYQGWFIIQWGNSDTETWSFMLLITFCCFNSNYPISNVTILYCCIIFVLLYYFYKHDLKGLRS